MRYNISLKSNLELATQVIDIDDMPLKDLIINKKPVKSKKKSIESENKLENPKGNKEGPKKSPWRLERTRSIG